jgi:hypothetical protein
MQNHGLVCKINKGLWEAESQRAKAGSETPNKNERLHGEAPAFLPPSNPCWTHIQIKKEKNGKRAVQPICTGLHRTLQIFRQIKLAGATGTERSTEIDRPCAPRKRDNRE